jgi:L-histidine N-alpha-methyltransferase
MDFLVKVYQRNWNVSDMVFQSSILKEKDLHSRLDSALQSGCNTVIEAAEDMNPVLDFAHSAARTLADHPKWLECRFLYDFRGSALFEEICRQPEYYPTRTEAAILREHADEISEATGPITLVELGSGNSLKTLRIFSSYLKMNGSVRYVPIDVSKAALRRACLEIGAWSPSVRVAGIKGTYECAFPLLRYLSPALVIFLGSTVGNFNEEQDRLFWQNISRCLSPGDFFLLGVDLLKETHLLEAAYNDKAGASAAFTLNLLERMNCELKAGIDMAHTRHVAHFSALKSRIEIFAEFEREHCLRIKPLKKCFRVLAGEQINVEISRKFCLKTLAPRLESYRFKTRRVFTDANNWFAVLLLERI